MCKYEHYGNCDPETKDQEYCIFHKPDKTEDEAREFYRKFLERFKPKKKKEEVVDDFGEKVEVERLVFEDDVDCTGYVFPEVPDDVDFSFGSATFEGNADFYNVIFKGIANFVGVIFEKDADFIGAIFEGNADFYNVIFKGNADFSDAIFKGNAWFSSKSMFHGKLDFSSVTFRTINIDLPGECFKHPQAEAEACKVQRIFYEREGRKDDADRMFVRERRALRRLNVLKAREELKEAKDSVSKIVAAGTLLKTYVSSAIEYTLADFTCKYGTDWKRPIVLWAFVVGVIFPLAYMFTHSVFGIHYIRIHSIWDYILNYPNYVYFSVVTATTLGYGDLHPVGWGKAIASAEAIFGMFMWAVFLAVFSRKYMR